MFTPWSDHSLKNSYLVAIQPEPDSMSLSMPFYCRPLAGIEKVDHGRSFPIQPCIYGDEIFSGSLLKVESYEDLGGVQNSRVC